MADSKQDTKTFTAPVGRVCLWYYQGQTNQLPRLALVTRANRDSLNLTLFTDGSPLVATQAGVRHKDDPWLAEHPSHAYECGCWDYLPGCHPLKDKAVAINAAELLARIEELERDALQRVEKPEKAASKTK